MVVSSWAETFQANCVGISWCVGRLGVKWAWAAGESGDVTQVSTARNTLDLLCIWFDLGCCIFINLLPAFSRCPQSIMTPYEVMTQSSSYSLNRTKGRGDEKQRVWESSNMKCPKMERQCLQQLPWSLFLCMMIFPVSSSVLWPACICISTWGLFFTVHLSGQWHERNNTPNGALNP